MGKWGRFLSVLLYSGLYILGRFLLAGRMVAGQVTGRALLSEALLLAAVLAAGAVLARRRWFLGALLPAAAAVFHVVNIEMIASLQSVFYLQDMAYGTDGTFLMSSLSGSSLLFYGALLLGAAGFFGFSWSRGARPRRRSLLTAAAVSLGLLTAAGMVFPRDYADDGWEVSSLIWASAAQSLTAERLDGSAEADSGYFPSEASGELSEGASSKLGNGGQRDAEAQESAERQFVEDLADRVDLKGTPGEGEQPNVLVVVLEGMAGPYLRQVQEAMDMEYPVVLEELSRIAEDFIIFPETVAHNRQTIRGLYAMLTGDYPELGMQTPRAYRYMARPPDKRPAAFPQILSAAGYRTVFLQGADLNFMSKDQFMKSAGFQEVMGKEYFQKQYIPFRWGPDDRAFFEESLGMIDSLESPQESPQKNPQPWCLMLLNVGTHHPYAVTEETAAEHPNEKIASAHLLDEAFADFYNGLEKRGVLEDTVVFVVADESHGVANQPYGRFWPVTMVRTPDSEPAMREGRFGLVDLNWTLLKHLNLEEHPQVIPRRDMLAEPAKHGAEHGREPADGAEAESRNLLFERFVSLEPGTVYQLLGTDRIKAFYPQGGELYGGSYRTEILKDEERERILNRVRELRNRESRRMAALGGEKETLRLIDDSQYRLTARELTTLSTGQYLEIPGDSIVTVKLRAAAKRVGEPSGPVQISLQFRYQRKDFIVDEMDIPPIPEGRELELSFSFDTDEAMDEMWTILTTRNWGEEGGEILLDLKEFSLSFEPGTLEEGFRENTRRLRPLDKSVETKDNT